MVLTLTVVRGPLLRGLISSLVAVGLTLPLGALFAVQRELDTAAYREAGFATTSEIHLAPDDVDRVRVDFGAAAMTAVVTDTPLFGRSGDEVPAFVHLTATPETSDVGFFTPATRIAGPAEVPDGRWIDVTADLARDLRAGPGDEVQLGVYPEVTVAYTVRSVHAVRIDRDGHWAQASAAAAFAATPDQDLNFQNVLMVAGWPPERVADVLADDFYTSRLAANGYLDPVVGVPVGELAERVGEQSGASLGLVAVTSLLALLAGGGFLLREVLVLHGTARTTLAELDGTGLPVRTSATVLSVVGACGGAAVVGIAGLVGLLPYTVGLLAPVMPPRLLPLWWGAVLLGVLLVVVAHLVAGILLRFRVESAGAAGVRR